MTPDRSSCHRAAGRAGREGRRAGCQARQEVGTIERKAVVVFPPNTGTIPSKALREAVDLRASATKFRYGTGYRRKIRSRSNTRTSSTTSSRTKLRSWRTIWP